MQVIKFTRGRDRLFKIRGGVLVQSPSFLFLISNSTLHFLVFSFDNHRCVQKDGEFSCDCKHNTAGRDCEKCKAFHFDKPWGRATAQDPHECQGK